MLPGFVISDLLLSFTIFLVPIVATYGFLKNIVKSTKSICIFRWICIISATLFSIKSILMLAGLLWWVIAINLLIASLAFILSCVIWRNSVDFFSTLSIANLKSAKSDVYQQGNVLDFTLQNIGDGVMVVNSLGKILFWNPAAQQIFGIRDNHASNDEIFKNWDLYYADTHTIIPIEKTPIRRALAGEDVSQYEIFVRNKSNQSVFWISKTARPIRSPYGKVIGAVAIFADITNRKNDEEKTRHYLLEIEDLYNNAPTGYHSLNEAGKIIKINNTELRWLGYNQSDVIHQPFEKFISEENKDIFSNKFNEIIVDGYCRDLRINLVRKNGGRFPVSINAILIRNDKGGVEHVRIAVSDLSQQQEAAKALIESENKFHTMASLSPVGIFQANVFGEYIYTNEKWSEITGISFDQTVDSGWKLSVHPEDVDRVSTEWDDLVHNTNVFHSEYRCVRKDGTVTWVIGQATIEKNITGETIGYVGTITDISEQKKASENLKAYTSELKRSNEDLENFIHVASHDLTEPIRMVSYFTQLIKENYRSQLDEEGAHYIDLAVKGSERMFTLIGDLLQFSRASRQVSFEPCDTAEVLCEVLIVLEKLIQDTNAKFEIDYLPVININPTQISQVFQNLITNSIKYRKGNPIIKIKAEMTEDRKFWEFSVQDNGIGIDAQDYPKLFILFSRLHKPGDYDGNGCGLAICKKIIERNGGKIWLNSELHVGTTFYFRLPVLKENKTQTENNKS